MIALVIVDVQKDFASGGSLAVPHGDDVVDPINQLLKKQHWDLVVATKDWHPQNHISFASNHAGKKPFETYELAPNVTSVLWPDHCVQYTPGAEFVSGLDTSRIDHVVLKGRTSEFYSAFADVLKKEWTDLQSELQKHGISEVVVVGLAYDYCVAQTAMDAARLGYKTSVIEACTRAISPQSLATAKKEMLDLGISII